MSGESRIPNVPILLFDFGQVLIEVFFDRAEPAFRRLIPDPSMLELAPLYNKHRQSEVFTQLEIGAITPAQFRQTMREQHAIEADDDAIDAAFNCILGNIFAGRLELLQRLSERYELYLLSNTNQLHHDAFIEPAAEILAMFRHCFYSHELGERKPDAAIYDKVVQHIGAPAQDILLIDDSAPNVRAAEHFGMPAIFLEHPDALPGLADLLLR